MASEIELNLETIDFEERIDVRAFLQAMEASTGILREIDKELEGGGLNWYFTDLSIGSAHVALISEWEGSVQTFGSEDEIANHRERVSRSFLQGLKDLDDRAVWPENFNEAAIHATERLVSVIREPISRITASIDNGAVITITERVAANIKQLLAGNYTELGSVEGVLETISLANRPTVNIRDEISGRSIEAGFSIGRLAELKEALNRRVILSGELVYNAHGRLNSVRSVTFIQLLDDEEEVSIDQVIGIAPNMTEGQSIEDYLDRMWDERT